MHGFNAANFHKVTISSHKDEHAFCEACELELTCLVVGPLAELKATLVLNHQTIICTVSRHCWVMISNKGIELPSLRRNISRTIDNKFHIPSGSRPLNGLK